MRSCLRYLTPQRWIILILLALFALPAAAQNTKGDKPVNNERRIRETKGKSVKRKEKGKTRDIAGRRLRTKDKSSANRANAGIRQPNPYAGRPRSTKDRAAKPQGRVYSEKPSDKPRRVVKGDIAGHPLRTTKARTTEASPTNVYPQQYAPQVARTHQTPRPPRYKSTAGGQPVVRRMPQAKERAWKGDIRGNPVVQPRSVSSQRQNTFPPNKQYTRHVKKRALGDMGESNKQELIRTKKLSRKPHTSDRGGGYVTSGNKGFVKRGKKNVYWGKFSKGERPVTTDLAGRPVRTRNYRSPSAGLVGRDTLKHFGHRPGGDGTFGGGRAETPGARTSNQGKGWRGDISGRRLRSNRRSSGDRAAIQEFPGFLSISKSGQVGKPLPSGQFSQRFRTSTVGQPLPHRIVGIGGLTVAEDMRKTRGVQKKRKGADVGSYSGNMMSTKQFQNQGEGFSGFTKVRKRGKGPDVGSYSGNMMSTKQFQNQGEGFSGYTKAQRPLKGGGSVSGSLWNNNQRAIAGRSLPRGAGKPAGFSGNFLSGKVYGDQGTGFTGYIKAQRPLKGGGSVSGKLWNNNGRAVTEVTLPKSAGNPARFSGNFLSGKVYGDQGAEFTGYIKTRKPEKGGGSVSGKLWNNQGRPITVLPGGGESLTASRFEGKVKAEKKKPSTSGFDNQGKVRLKEQYTQSPNAVAESTRKHKPEKAGFAVDGLQIRVAKKDMSVRKSSVDANEFASGVRMQERRHNPYAADEALKGTYYGSKNLGAFHGNIKARKFQSDRRFHPDAKFAHSPENNVKDERTFMTNVKLWWTNLFHDSESQPTSVREKERRPRYDKREKGMWAE